MYYMCIYYICICVYIYIFILYMYIYIHIIYVYITFIYTLSCIHADIAERLRAARDPMFIVDAVKL